MLRIRTTGDWVSHFTPELEAKFKVWETSGGEVAKQVAFRYLAMMKVMLRCVLVTCVLMLLLIVNGHTLLPLLTLENQRQQGLVETTEPLTLLNMTEVKKYINEDKLIDADTENGVNLTITQYSFSPVNQRRINHLSDLRLYNHEISEEDMNHYINNCSDDLQNSAQPVLTLDSDLLQVKGSAQLTNISEEQVCASVQPMSIFFNRRHNFKEAQEWCSQLGGSLPLPESHETNTFFYNQALKSRKGCDASSILYWLDAVNNASGDFYKMTDGKPLKWTNLCSWGRYNLEILCLVIDNRRFKKGSAEWRLTSCRWPSCGVLCSFDYSPRLKLQGKCDSFTLDTYMLMSTDVDNNIQFVNREYRLSLVNNTWTMTEENQQFPMAEMTSEMDTPLGRHWWRVWQSGCSQDKMVLVLSACGPKEYTCNDGTCININKRCNLILECPDHSDEEHCEKVLLPYNYYPRLPPPSTEQQPFQLRLTLSISSVRKFCPTTFTVVIDTNLIFRWSDSRLTYRNLQTSHYDNTVPNMSQVWHPKVDIKDGYYGAVDLAHHSRNIHILRDSYPSRIFDTSSEDNEYPGDWNRLQMDQKQIISFRCHLNLHMYPFDTQRCSIIISVQDLHVGVEELLEV
ncbi:hypothetical protein Pmani_006578 [Petrolisthes manimaculis]|uniref:Neurotransmitter-gated ion-channel ligand-binding domain-containing protein n=1 Tax=Petrolisthes manimaculis TaxID=1843537 RepID=A0AAE1QCK2_9EUCA|nr:hypothetical protein Pmani_006578 [Petrolisthes manimaculis]